MTTEMIVYDKIENPLEFVEKFGDALGASGLLGTNKRDVGRVVAMTCIYRRIDPLEFARTFHVIDGKLSMRADAMHAEFRKSGGQVRWLNSGDDGVEGKAVFSFEGMETEVSYKMEEAKKAGRVKKGSNYEKDPGSMLRARLISRAVRMLCPEIVSGYYAPEEIERTGDSPTETGRSTEEALQRKQELQEMQDSKVIDVEATPVEVVPETDPEPSSSPSASDVPFDTDTPEIRRISVTQRQQVSAICEQLGSTTEAFAESYVNSHSKAWTDMSEKEGDAVIEKLTAMAQKQFEEKSAK